jgi:hypothetical protein
VKVSCRHLLSSYYFSGPLRTPCMFYALQCWLAKGVWEFPPYFQLLFNCKSLFCVHSTDTIMVFEILRHQFPSRRPSTLFAQNFTAFVWIDGKKLRTLNSVSFISGDFKFRTTRIIITGSLPCAVCSLAYYKTNLNSIYCRGKFLPASYSQRFKMETDYRSPFEIRLYISTLADFQKRKCQ